APRRERAQQVRMDTGARVEGRGRLVRVAGDELPASRDADPGRHARALREGRRLRERRRPGGEDPVALVVRPGIAARRSRRGCVDQPVEVVVQRAVDGEDPKAEVAGELLRLAREFALDENGAGFGDLEQLPELARRVTVV